MHHPYDLSSTQWKASSIKHKPGKNMWQQVTIPKGLIAMFAKRPKDQWSIIGLKMQNSAPQEYCTLTWQDHS